MTIVVDCALPQEKRQYVLSKIAFTLKTHSELFKNVRLNVVEWSDDAHMENRVTPLIQLTMSSYYEKIHSVSKEKKHISYLMEYLKKFRAYAPEFETGCLCGESEGQPINADLEKKLLEHQI